MPGGVFSGFVAGIAARGPRAGARAATRPASTAGSGARAFDAERMRPCGSRPEPVPRRESGALYGREDVASTGEFVVAEIAALGVIFVRPFKARRGREVKAIPVLG